MQTGICATCNCYKCWVYHCLRNAANERECCILLINLIFQAKVNLCLQYLQITAHCWWKVNINLGAVHLVNIIREYSLLFRIRCCNVCYYWLDCFPTIIYYQYLWIGAVGNLNNFKWTIIVSIWKRGFSSLRKRVGWFAECWSLLIWSHYIIWSHYGELELLGKNAFYIRKFDSRVSVIILVVNRCCNGGRDQSGCVHNE